MGHYICSYPNLQIIYRAGCIHSNVGPISRLRRRVPREIGPKNDDTHTLTLESLEEDAIRSFYNEIAPEFESKVLNHCIQLVKEDDTFSSEVFNKEISIKNAYLREMTLNYSTARSYNVLISIEPEEVKRFISRYKNNLHFKNVLSSL